MGNYLDRCDGCHKPRICRGYGDLVLCDECIENRINEPRSKKEECRNVDIFVCDEFVVDSNTKVYETLFDMLEDC